MIATRGTGLRTGGAGRWEITLLSFSLVFLLAAPAPAVADSPATRAKVTFALDWFPSPSNAAAYIAQAKGYYADAGLDVTVQPGSSQALSIQLVASGQAQFGLETAGEILEARAHGIPVIALAATLQRSPAALFFHKGQAIRDYGDLNGRTVYTQITTPEWQYQKTKYHLDKIVDLQFRGSYAAFAADPRAVAQGYLTSTGDELATQGIETETIASAEDIGYGSVLFTTDELIARHPDLVRDFVRATAAGWSYYRSHPEESSRLLLPHTSGRSEADLIRESERQAEFIWTGDALTHGFGWMTTERWQKTIDQLVLEHAIDSVPAATVFTTQFLAQP